VVSNWSVQRSIQGSIQGLIQWGQFSGWFQIAVRWVSTMRRSTSRYCGLTRVSTVADPGVSTVADPGIRTMVSLGLVMYGSSIGSIQGSIQGSVYQLVRVITRVVIDWSVTVVDVCGCLVISALRRTRCADPSSPDVARGLVSNGSTLPRLDNIPVTVQRDS